MDHPDLKARNLSQAVKDQCLDLYSLEIDKNKNLTGQLINCINELQQTKTHSFNEYLDSIDLLTNKKWQHIFPELVND
jgi:hypothetical protein